MRQPRRSLGGIAAASPKRHQTDDTIGTISVQKCRIDALWTEIVPVVIVRSGGLTRNGSEAAVVLLGDPPPEWGAEAPWAGDIKDLRRRYLGTDRRAGSGSGSDPAEGHEDILRRSAFAHVTTMNWPWTLERTVDELVGLQFSYSFSSPALLGARRQDYGSQVRDVLLRQPPTA